MQYWNREFGGNMDIEEQFSESEMKHVNSFLKRFEMTRKREKYNGWFFIFVFLLISISIISNLHFAVVAGERCGILHGYVDALAYFFKSSDYNRTYEGCEMFVAQRVGNAYNGMAVFVFNIFIVYVYRRSCKDNAIFHKCWQLLSSKQ
jgi:hypothetical protein